MRRLRLPLTAKVLFSYLLVIAAGAVPTFVFLEARFAAMLTHYEAEDLARRGRLIAATLVELPPAERQVVVRELAATLPERLTFMDAAGNVIFDSEMQDVRSLDNHHGRDEVRQALGFTADRPSFAPDQPGLGMALRTSATTGVKALYAAYAVAGPDGEATATHVVRLAMPLDQVDMAADALMITFRNSQAVAISIAILLSMVAAFAFVRPLRLLVGSARALSAGDYTAAPAKLGDNEIGDVGRALQTLGLELRRRLANAEAGETLVEQIVAAVPFPMCVVDADHALVAINGPALDLFEARDSRIDDRLREVLSRDDILQAAVASERAGSPQRVRLQKKKGKRVWVLRLVHPGGRPFLALFGGGPEVSAAEALPAPDEVTVASMRSLLEAAMQVTNGHSPKWLKRLPRKLASAPVADLRGRALAALRLAVSELSSDSVLTGIELVADETRIGVSFDAVSNETADAMHALLGPLGGAVEASDDHTTAWIPRA